jgi:molecular chaperone DnaJ
VPDDYYELLGVGRDASDDEIKRAYRKLARELHPDANPGDAAAEERFKKVAVAYEVLRDPDKRRQYDMFGTVGAGAGGPGDPFAGFGGGISDLFDAFFGGTGFGGGAGGRRRGPSGPPRGADLEVALELSFVEAAFGGEHDVTVRTAVSCETCSGSGAEPGTSPVRCPTCDGAGEVRRVRQSILGQMVTASVCDRCHGTGQIIESPCATCRGDGRRIEDRTYTVDVPGGIDDGQTLRLSGRGAVGARGGAPGDLYVHIRVRPHDRFVRQGYDLVHELHVPLTQAALGAHFPYETLDGVEDLVVPAGTQTGRVFRLRGRGIPHVDGRGRGDLLVQVVVDTPTAVTGRQEELLRALAAERGEDVAPPDTGLFSRIKSAFK